MAQHYSALKDAYDLFQFVVYRTSIHVLKRVNYMPRKGVILEIANIFFLFWFNSRITLTRALKNMKLGRDSLVHKHELNMSYVISSCSIVRAR